MSIPSLFPWVGFGRKGSAVGNVLTEWVGNASFPASMPLLTVLAFLGLGPVVRPSRRPGPSPAALRALIIGAAVGAVATLSFASIAHRYTADFLPGAVLLAAVGTHLVLGWAARRPGAATARLAGGALVLLLVLSTWFNVGLGTMYQRLLVPASVIGDASWSGGNDLTDFLSFQYDLHKRFPGGDPPYVDVGTALPPARSSMGRAFALPGCDALFWSDGLGWKALERSEAGGLFQLRVRFPTRPTGWEPLLVNRSGGERHDISVRVVDRAHVQFAYDTAFTATPVRLPPGRSHEVRILWDAVPGSPTDGLLSVTVDEVTGWSSILPNKFLTERLRPLEDFTIGRGEVGGVAPRFTGQIERLPARTGLCRELTAGH